MKNVLNSCGKNMFVGFDYGTSNCAMAQMRSGQAQLIPLYGPASLVPSTLYTLERAFIADAIFQQLPEGPDKRAFAQSRAVLLNQAIAGKRAHALADAQAGIFYGDDAIAQYVADPSEGYFIKSPKSFLGASGLRQASVEFFEDVVAAMMLNVKTRAEQALGAAITQAVIGRPVNFQGINSEHSNRQAQEILRVAAGRAGFTAVEFLFEPLAAGFDFETRLRHNHCVLVVDVGGGTTDCSLVRMGPDHLRQLDRTQDCLGHSGERCGGNDFDITFAQHRLMPEFGMLSPLVSGLPMPVMPFFNAMKVNDLVAQADFYGTNTGLLLEELLRTTSDPQLFERFIKMRAAKQNFAVVRAAERGKIALSSATEITLDLAFIEENLQPLCTAQQLAEVSAPILQKIASLIHEVQQQAGVQPDSVYITGGSAKSPLLTQLIRSLFGPQITIVDGDHFGSVAAGLAVWGERLFR